MLRHETLCVKQFSAHRTTRTHTTLTRAQPQAVRMPARTPLIAPASRPRIQMCNLGIWCYGRAGRERLNFFVLGAAYTDAASTTTSQKISMRSFSKQQIASGIALVVAAFFVVVLHSLNYSKEHQVYGIALVGVFGFLFLSRDKAPEPDEPWWW